MGLSASAMALLPVAKGTPGGNEKNSADRPYELNRYMGGHKRINHPYVSGFWYIVIQPPLAIFTGSTGVETSTWLHSMAEGFTPPTRTLTKVDVPGLGGMSSSFVAGQQLTRTFTTTFREYQDTPVLNSINLWTTAIDPRYGLSPFAGNEYIPANYKGNAWVYLCKPTSGSGDLTAASLTADDIEQFFFFEGVFPESPPFDGFNSDISTNDVVQLSVTWSFDGWLQGKEHVEALSAGLTVIAPYNLAEMYTNHIKDDAITFSQPSSKSTQTTLGG